MARAKIRDLRDWIDYLDGKGQLKRVTGQVDWNEELDAIVRKVSAQGGPALLFENIKDYPRKGSLCSRLFRKGMGSRPRVAMALGLSPDADDLKLLPRTHPCRKADDIFLSLISSTLAMPRSARYATSCRTFFEARFRIRES